MQTSKLLYSFLCIKGYEERSVRAKKEKQKDCTAGGILNENNGTIHHFLLGIQRLKRFEIPNILTM